MRTPAQLSIHVVNVEAFRYRSARNVLPHRAGAEEIFTPRGAHHRVALVVQVAVAENRMIEAQRANRRKKPEQLADQPFSSSISFGAICNRNASSPHW
jgi:hypothetical protein